MTTIWFVILAGLLIGYAVLDGFDLGVGTLHLWIARTDEERRISLNAIAPVWDGNEVWLVAWGASLFLAFPRAFAVAFSEAIVLEEEALLVEGVFVQSLFIHDELDAPWVGHDSLAQPA